MKESTPIPGTLTYYAWSIDPVRRGPFLRRSRRRAQAIDTLRARVSALSLESASVRLMETTFIAPVKHRPDFDITLIISGKHQNDEVNRAISSADICAPDLVRQATNPLRFGDTDTANGPVLLNHFASSAAPESVVNTWHDISKYYGATLHVTNSTLLQFHEPTPYVALNYAVVPGPVIRFLLDQTIRPSFHRTVSKRLSAVPAHALPIFAQRLQLQSSLR